MNSCYNPNQTISGKFQYLEEDKMSDRALEILEFLKQILSTNNSFSFKREDYAQDEWEEIKESVKFLHQEGIILPSFERTPSIDNAVITVKRGMLWKS